MCARRMADARARLSRRGLVCGPAPSGSPAGKEVSLEATSGASEPGYSETVNARLLPSLIPFSFMTEYTDLREFCTVSLIIIVFDFFI